MVKISQIILPLFIAAGSASAFTPASTTVSWNNEKDKGSASLHPE